MTGRFDYFVIFAEMRTGSNFLEANLNAFEAVTCFGEAFNPHFVGYPNRTDILGVTLPARSADPKLLLQKIKTETEGLGGFRFFHDHDPRVLDLCLEDPRCAKIVLTRNPADSYVSWKIAQKTNQWKLTDVRRRRDSKARFDETEFREHLGTIQSFQTTLLNRLQRSGQTAFYIGYDDLHDLEVINGLARFLGLNAQLPSLDDRLKPQNPSALEDKVVNYQAMQTALAGFDRFDLDRTPNFEPRRGPAVPGFVASETGLVFMTIPSGPEQPVLRWLAALSDAGADGLQTRFTQKSLRQWLQDHPNHRTFTVLRHPVERAHAAFCDKILRDGEGSFLSIRKTLRRAYKLPIPGRMPDDAYDRRAHRAAFAAFLDFLRANLAGQTTIRIDGHWASQSNTIQGFGQFLSPDMIVRENEMEAYLPALAMQLGMMDAPLPEPDAPEHPVALGDIYDEGIEAQVRDVYARDYLLFGFGDWKDAL